MLNRFFRLWIFDVSYYYYWAVFWIVVVLKKEDVIYKKKITVYWITIGILTQNFENKNFTLSHQYRKKKFLSKERAVGFSCKGFKILFW